MRRSARSSRAIAVLIAVVFSCFAKIASAQESTLLAEDRRLLGLIDQLREDDRWKARVEAAVLLGRSSDIRARRPLTKALGDPHYAVRAAAIRSLANLQDARAIRPLLDRLGDDEPFVRNEARRAIDRFPIDVSFQYLVHALKRHPNPIVRFGAAERLSESPGPETYHALLDAIGDEDQVGRFAVSAIRTLPEEKAVDLFLEGLASTDYGVQIAAVHALVDIGNPRATEPFIRLLDSQVTEVTMAAAQGLRAFSSSVDRNRIFVLARRANSRFERARAIKVLGVLGGEDAAQLLLNALDDQDVLVRGAAVSGLSSLGELRAIPKLEEMKKEEENGRIISLVKKTLISLQRLRERRKA